VKRIGLVFLLLGGAASAQQTADPAQQAVQAERQARLAQAQARLAQAQAVAANLTKLRETLAPGIARGNWAPYGNPPDRPVKWWNDPTVAATAGLSKDQQRKMDEVFLQYRLKLIDLNAALEKEEVALEPLIAADSLDESKIAGQIDRVAQARAELEKANGRMLLGMRMVLTPEQWRKMQK
jgi:hypothetical protein